MDRYSNFTYYIYCDNLDLIEQACIHIFEQEGSRRVSLPTLSVEIEELRRRPWLLCNELWVIGLFVGSLGWTIVKILPQELLCRRTRDANRPRLSQLAMQLGTDAFYIGCSEEVSILMETDAKGSVFISGSVDRDNSEENKFFEEEINLVDRILSLEHLKRMYSTKPQRFFLLKVPQQMQTAEQKLQEEQNRRFNSWQEEFLDSYAKRYFSSMTSDELEQWKVRFRENSNQLFDEKGGKKLFRAWSYALQDLSDMASGFQKFEIAIGRLLGGTPNYWHLGNESLVYRAYTQQQQLEADGARLLFFQPTAKIKGS
ncbi:hypothetical protein I8748_19490 [Nostoc sp. CENA67]|uniref:Uncharacterized protein n=1 Tax=Amazonocrinis nigriterrae CENA67 TaxID=2794033 RepID=A0A8J7HQW6_9NOST|nr:hypothetical protein [Amazonocrinis nigriterrae]MBH8564343.1 hypothetical protein [Amazonocrinis nigriterrae CENA67]